MDRLHDEEAPVAGLECPECGEALLFSALQDAFALLCRRGHQPKAKELAGEQASRFRAALEPLLLNWEAKLDSLKNLSVSARVNGFESMCAVFNKHIQKLEARIDALRDAARPPSVRLPPPAR